MEDEENSQKTGKKLEEEKSNQNIEEKNTNTVEEAKKKPEVPVVEE